MRHLKINYRIEEYFVKQGSLKSSSDPRVARLFKNWAALQKLKQITYQPNPEYVGRHDGAIGNASLVPVK